MKRLKVLLSWFIHPPVWLVLLLIPVAIASLVAGLSPFSSGTVLAYFSYALSAYTLVVAIISLPKLGRWFRSWIHNHPFIAKIKNNKWGKLFLEDITFRSTTLLYQGLATNLVYAVFRQFTALKYGSVWFGAIALYYTFLCVVKVFLICRSKKLRTLANEGDRTNYEYKCYGLCGVLILLLNAGMSGIIIMMVRQNQHFEYPGFIIYLSAAYTFYGVITAIINVFKFRKLQSPILSASKAITLVSALMSLMVLQTALITQFGAEDVTFRQTANNLTGAAVCLISLGVSIYMSVRAYTKLRNLKASKNV